MLTRRSSIRVLLVAAKAGHCSRARQRLRVRGCGASGRHGDVGRSDCSGLAPDRPCGDSASRGDLLAWPGRLSHAVAISDPGTRRERLSGHRTLSPRCGLRKAEDRATAAVPVQPTGAMERRDVRRPRRRRPGDRRGASVLHARRDRQSERARGRRTFARWVHGAEPRRRLDVDPNARRSRGARARSIRGAVRRSRNDGGLRAAGDVPERRPGRRHHDRDSKARRGVRRGARPEVLRRVQGRASLELGERARTPPTTRC